ncbi:hypothetical protein M3612_18205 [Niallia taxi]|uniref:hypothetical protein n=1 Tax=Niallia taxi TaxID=2499688 RepID=UPI00203FB1C5|nr:hypothetical protein [Niallia taxi]MCM3216421.1 hypothetical protein [Niallia taxi]
MVALLYDKPKKAFLHNDLLAYESEENDKQLIYHFKKGYVTVLGEYSRYYDNEVGKAYIIRLSFQFKRAFYE